MKIKKNFKIRYSTDIYNPVFTSLLILGVIEPAGIFDMSELYGGVWRIIHLPFTLLLYFSLMFCLITFVSNRAKQVDAFSILIILFLIWTICTNVINGHGFWESTFFSFKIISGIFILRYYIMNEHIEEYVSVFNFWMVVFVVINVITQLIYPNGLYIGATQYGMWLFGNRNAFIFFYYMGVMVATLHYLIKFKRLKLSYFLYVTLMVFSEIIGGSATGGLSIIVTVLLIVFLRNIKMSKFKVCGISVLLSIFISYLIINVGVNTSIARAIEIYLNRNITFTGRSTIWNTALRLLEGHQLMGLGWAEIPVGWYWDVYQCHNNYLDLIFTGGIILFAIYLALVYVSIRRLDVKEKNISRAILAFLFVGYTVVYIMEARRKEVGIFLLLAMMYYSNYFDKRIVLSDREGTEIV